MTGEELLIALLAAGFVGFAGGFVTAIIAIWLGGTWW